jgi:hypothetical protein
MSNQPIEARQVVVQWDEEEIRSLHVQACNMFSFHSGPDGIVVTLGYAAPPFVQGTPDEQRAALMSIESVQAKALYRIQLAYNRVPELLSAVAQLMNQLTEAGILTNDAIQALPRRSETVT